MKKLFVLCILSLVSSGCGKKTDREAEAATPDPTPRSSATVTPAPTRPPTTTTPTGPKDTTVYVGVYAVYRDNHVVADKKYKGKLAEIRAELFGIETVKGQYVLVLSIPWAGLHAYHLCQVSAEDVEKVKVGQYVTAVGVVEKYADEKLYLKDCRVVDVDTGRPNKSDRKTVDAWNSK